MQPSLFGEIAPEPVDESGLFADVVFDRPLDHAYTYAVPGEVRLQIGVGKRVLAPFGRGDRQTLGFCVGVHSSRPERAVKELIRVLDDEALLTPHLMQLTRWMADYYLCGWGQVLNVVVPAGAKQKAGTRSVMLIEPLPDMLLPQNRPALTAKQQAVLEVLRQHNAPIEMAKLAELARCNVGPIRALVEKGMVRKRVGRVESAADQEATDTPHEAPPAPHEPITLTPDQVQVWAVLEQAVRQGGFKPFLLHGVTGSGKTELYLRAIEEVVRQGKEALVLVPEISLTPQTIQAFKGRCAGVAVLHSHMGDAERGGHWRKIAGGQVQVIVGARSAIFAPTRKLGLIVIDEEHESSFKQDATPRYHARDVAVMRARLEEIPIIMGSATPALESWHNAQRGHYTLLTLPRRVYDRPLPHVALIDLRYDRPPDRRIQGISPSLERAMKHALSENGQVILLLNRRGFSTHILCPACGHVEQCKFCDLALTYHREKDVVACHYCGYEEKPNERCPECNLGQIRYSGIGTEKLEEEIKKKFPQHVCRRMDSDTMKRPGSHRQELDAFRKGQTHILMGTQMIAKGLDFPNVTLVGVVNADVGLHRADFRAAERTFQLLAQVAGRTGRGPRGGKVLVQTFNPEHPSIALAALHDYLAFAKVELEHRGGLRYPPFQRMARVVVRAKDQQQASDQADQLAGAFRTALARLQQGEAPAELRLLGPAEAPIFRLKGYYRFHFQLQSPSSAFLHQVLRQVMGSTRVPQGVDVTVDVDPQDMM